MHWNRICVMALFFFLGIASIGTLSHAAILSFPGAEGGGGYAIGGRGGKIIEVINLNDSGPGSFRAACQAKGPRIVVFRVAGIIDISHGDRIYINNPYITIAGQTAPGSGITIKGSCILVKTHDVIIRYLRIRGGKRVQGRDNIWVGDGSYNVIIDHCSLTWATDENLSIWSGKKPAHHITFSRNLIAEGLEPHSCGILTGSDVNCVDQTNISIHHNLIMHNHNRSPLIKSGTTRVINNLVYDWYWFGMAIKGGVKIDIIGNKIKKGPTVPKDRKIDMLMIKHKENIPDWGPPGDPSIYIKDNIGINQTSPSTDNWKLLWINNNKSPVRLTQAKYTRQTPISEPTPAIKIDPVNKLESIILNDVGAYKRLDEKGQWVPNRDSVDNRLINEYSMSTGKIPSNESEVGGYPKIDPGAPPMDNDHDGMPDVWERAHGFNPKDPSDGPQDANNNGYTNVEEYLNGCSPCSKSAKISPPTNLILKLATNNRHP